MKTIYLLIAVCFSSLVFGQDVRSFFPTNITSEMYQNSLELYEYNSTLYFVSSKEYNSAGNLLIFGQFDSNLSTSNYHEINYVFPITGSHSISGTSVNGNHLLIAFIVNEFNLPTNSTIGSMVYLDVNLLTNQIENQYVFANDYKGGLYKSRQIGNELVTYIIANGNKLNRISLKLSDNGVLQSEEIDDSVFVQTTTANNSVMWDSSINGEFVSYFKSYNSCSVYKRVVGQTLEKKTIIFPMNTYDLGLVCLPNSTLLVAKGSQYIILSSSLDSIGTGNFMNSSQVTNREFSVIGNDLYELRAPNQFRKYDQQIQLVDSSIITSEINSIQSKQLGDDKYFYGNIIQYNGEYQYFVIKNGSFEPFTEYGRRMKNHSLEFDTGHANTFFNWERLNSDIGCIYNFHNKDYHLISGSHGLVLGIDNAQTISGISEDNMFGYQIVGPINNIDFADTNLYASKEIIDKYNRGYYVTKQMIEDHLAVLYYGNPNYVAPHGIREWPAHGNLAIGEAQNLAPFVDVNNNGIYEPMQGDYPKIYGDECLLNVFHQNPYYSSDKLEVYQYFFTYECDTSEVLNNTIFMKYQVINRGGDLDSTYIGSFVDFEIGGPNDDFGGTNVELGLTYCYNSDLHDASDGVVIGFGDTIPAAGVMILSGINKIADGIDNSVGGLANQSSNGNNFGDGIIDNEVYTLESSRFNLFIDIFSTDRVTGYYNFLKGNNYDGSLKLINGTIPYRHDFFGNSDPEFYTSYGIDHGNNYSETTAGTSPGDRRMLASSGPGQFNSGDTINYLTAYIVSIDSNDMSFPPSVNKLFADAAWLKNAFATNDLGCGKTFGAIQNDLATIELEKYDVNVYPNPFHDELIITNLGNEQSSIFIYDLNGNLLLAELSNENAHKINLELKSGIYILKVENNLGSVVKRIVKY